MDSNTDPAHGSALCHSSGDCTYTPSPGYIGPDSFDYTVADGRGGTDVGTVSVTVEANGAPVADDQSTTTPSKPAFLNLSAADPDFDPLSYAIVSLPSHGGLDDCTYGYCTYTPDLGYLGPDTFTWKANDGTNDSNVATFSIEVVANQPPEAHDQSTSVLVGKPRALTLSASDPEGEFLSYTIVGGPTHGTLTDCAASYCTYDPDPGYVGPDSFTWQANDGMSDSNVATFSLDVHENPFVNFTTVFGTDTVSAGFGGMRDNGMGTLAVSGVSGSVTRAYLYWHGPTNTNDPAANAAVTFDGHAIIGTNIGLSNDNCWGFVNSQAYRADVTPYVSGNGSFALDGFVKQTGSININGASLIVFFDDGIASNNRDVILFNGNDSNIVNPYDDDGWNVTLAGINYSSGSSNITLHVSDGQNFEDDALVLNGTTLVDRGQIFSGDSVPFGAFDASGHLWDIKSYDITSFLSPGGNSLNLTTGVSSDCLSLIVAAIDLPSGAAPAAHLTLSKSVDNTGGGTALASAWTLSATGPTPISGVTGAAAVTNATVLAGTYTLAESTGPASYNPGTWNCTAGTLTGSSLVLAAGDSATCSITNTYVPPAAHLTLSKSVDNTGGGTALASAWTLSATGPTPISGVTGAAAVTNATVLAGTYTLAKSTGPASYNPGTWNCTAGTLTGSSLVLAAGDSATCSITNTYVPPAAHLTLSKSVDNTGGGTALASAWTLSATGPTPISGVTGAAAVTNATVLAGTYTLAELTGPASYNPGTWNCTAGTLTGSSLVLAAGDSATCSITNTYVPPAAATELTLGGDTSGQYSDHATITATLTVGGIGIANSSVTISFGSASQTATTDALGVASASFTIPWPGRQPGDRCVIRRHAIETPVLNFRDIHRER